MSSRGFLLLALLIYPTTTLAVSIPTVPVGDAGNAPNVVFGDSRGAVARDFRIGTYEVTNSQYAAFLNAKAKSDPFGLYDEAMTGNARGGIVRSGTSGSYSYAPKTNLGNKPVNYVTLFDAMRFTNWLHNGQGSGNTETGAYTLVGGAIPFDPTSITRSAGAKWFLPSRDEWYKAAYYQPASAGGDVDDYWLFPTRSNTAPIKAFITDPSFDIANPGYNVANYDSGINFFMTSVGTAGPLSTSYYGTYDQAGNVAEWNETTGFTGTAWVRAGGSYNSAAPNLQSDLEISYSPTSTFPTIGFRVAADISVPEPATWVLGAVALCSVAVFYNRSRRAAA